MASMVEEITKRYEDFLAIPFPAGHRTKTIGDKTLALYQSEMLGYVISYSNTNGALGSRQKVVLTKDFNDLKKALPEFSKEAQEYFQGLLSIVEVVLHTAHDQPQL